MISGTRKYGERGTAGEAGIVGRPQRGVGEKTSPEQRAYYAIGLAADAALLLAELWSERNRPPHRLLTERLKKQLREALRCVEEAEGRRR